MQGMQLHYFGISIEQEFQIELMKENSLVRMVGTG